MIAIFLILRGEPLEEAIPVLGLYAFAGYRLMPALQQIFGLHLVEVRRTGCRERPSRAHLRRSSERQIVRRPLQRQPYRDVPAHRPARARRHRLHLSWRLPALRDINLTISQNTVGIVGPTGSGKTTLVDVILGLLRAQVGVIRVDGVALTDANLRAWQNGLGYARSTS